MINDVDVGSQCKAFQARDNAQRFGVERVRTADGFLKDPREDDFRVCGSMDSVRCFWRGKTLCGWSKAYRPTSNAGDAIGENSVMI